MLCMFRNAKRESAHDRRCYAGILVGRRDRQGIRARHFRGIGTFPRSSKLRGLSLHNPKTPSHTRAWLLPHTAFTSGCASWWTPPFSPRKACDEERSDFADPTTSYFTNKFRTTQEYNPQSLFPSKPKHSRQ
jgi:hypothetical protein